MFDRYKLEDLFLASIDVRYPVSNIWDINIGGIFMMSCAGYGYLTVLARQNGKFIDLNDQTRNITARRDPMVTSYIIDYIEPLSKYYTPTGKTRTVFSKRQALKEAEKHYNRVHQEHSAVEEQGYQKVKTLEDM